MNGNLDKPDKGAFGIEDTIEMNSGSAELISDLLGSEGMGQNPDDIKPIIEDANPPEPGQKKPAKAQAADKDELKGADFIDQFLQDGDEEDEEEEELVSSKKTTKAPTSSKAPENDEADSEGDDAGEGNTSVFQSFSKDLFRLGVFNLSEDDGEEEPVIDSPEKFLERFNMEKRRGAIEIVDNFIGQFGEDYQHAFDAIFVKGVNPKDYFATYNNILNFSDMDMKNESNQERVMRTALAEQGFEGEDIDTEIERLKSYGDLETVATRHHKVLVKKEATKMKQLEENAQRELQQKAALKNQYIQNVTSILQDKVKAKEFDGIPISPKIANELQDFLLVDKYKTPSGETLTDFDRAILELKRPENHPMKVKVALLLKLLEKDPTLSTIQKTGVTKQSTQLFGEVARQVSGKKTTNRSQSATQDSKRWFL